MEQLSKRDFRELALDALEDRTGLKAPKDPTPEEEEAYREKAWRSYAVDITNRDEWGTSMEATQPPHGEEPEL